MAEEIQLPLLVCVQCGYSWHPIGVENQSDARIMNADHSVGIRLSTRGFTGSLLVWRNLKRRDHFLRRRGERQVPQLLWNFMICDVSWRLLRSLLVIYREIGTLDQGTDLSPTSNPFCPASRSTLSFLEPSVSLSMQRCCSPTNLAAASG